VRALAALIGWVLAFLVVTVCYALVVGYCGCPAP
jgi:hypothetical protein